MVDWKVPNSSPDTWVVVFRDWLSVERGDSDCVWKEWGITGAEHWILQWQAVNGGNPKRMRDNLSRNRKLKSIRQDEVRALSSPDSRQPYKTCLFLRFRHFQRFPREGGLSGAHRRAGCAKLLHLRSSIRNLWAAQRFRSLFPFSCGISLLVGVFFFSSDPSHFSVPTTAGYI